MRQRDWRRVQGQRLVRRRKKNFWWWTGKFGRLRKNHFGCGCPICKPWKHKLDDKYKISELRKLQDEE